MEQNKKLKNLYHQLMIKEQHFSLKLISNNMNNHKNFHKYKYQHQHINHHKLHVMQVHVKWIIQIDNLEQEVNLHLKNSKVQ
jgi:hypothetical protein